MKTIENATKECSKSILSNSNKSYLESGFRAGVEFAQQWISVEDEVPAVNEDDKFDLKYGYSKEVIVKMKGGKYAVGIYCKNSNSFSLKGSVLAYKITHWRPIEYK